MTMAIVPMPKTKPKDETPQVAPVFVAMATAQMQQAEKEKGK